MITLIKYFENYGATKLTIHQHKKIENLTENFRGNTLEQKEGKTREGDDKIIEKNDIHLFFDTLKVHIHVPRSYHYEIAPKYHLWVISISFSN